MKKGIRWQCRVLTAAVFLFVASAPAQLISPTPAEMEQLLAKYLEYGLPLPPRDAKLVRIPLGQYSHTVGFVSKKAKGWKSAEVLIGTTTAEEYSLNDQSPTQLDTEGFCATSDLSWPNAPFEINTGLATALQCQARGYTNLALQLWKASVVKSIGFDRPAAFVHPSDLTGPSTVAFLAWIHWANELIQPRSDRRQILQRMKVLRTAEPLLVTWDNRKVFEGLEAALSTKAAPPGSIDARINDLVELSFRFPASRSDMGSIDPPSESYFGLVLFGFDAVPALVNHLADKRLTRSMQDGFNNFSSYIRPVKEIVSDILQDLAGQRLKTDWRTVEAASVNEWLQAAQSEGEENYMASRALRDNRYENNQNRYMLRVLAHKYPHRLVAMYRKVLSDEPETDSNLLAESISLSQLPAKEKLAALLEGATSAILNHRRAAITYMRKVDGRRFKQTIKNQLRELSTKPDKHSTGEGHIAYSVIEAGDPGLWKALTAAAHRADSDFKSEAMWAMCNSLPQETQQAQRAQFLESFLEDRAEVNPKRFKTTLASQAEIRNLAAEHLGHRVGIFRNEDPNWSAEQWRQFREQVRNEFKRMLRESAR